MRGPREVPEGSLRPVPHRCCRPSNLHERQQAARNVNKPTPRADLAGCQQMPTDANRCQCQLMPMPTGNLLEAAGHLLGISGHAMCWEKQSILALAISRSIWRRTSSSGFSLGMNLVRVLLVRWRTCKLLPSSEISSSDHPHSLGAMIDELVLTINVDNY